MATSQDTMGGLKTQNFLREPSHLALGDALKSDTVDLPYVTREIGVATTVGAIKVDTLGGETVVIPSGAIPVGGSMRLRVTRIYATGTAAVGLVLRY